MLAECVRKWILTYSLRQQPRPSHGAGRTRKRRETRTKSPHPLAPVRHFVLSVLMIAACRIGPAAAGAANTSPVVELTEPDPDRAFIAPADISLAAFCYDAEDNHNVVVEFFEGTHSLGFGMPGASGCGTAPGCYSYLVWSN